MVEVDTAPVKDTLLVVEDEDIARNALVSILQRRNYRVFNAQNGSDAVNLIAKHNVDLVLLDIKMNRPDGIDVAARVNQSSPDKPIIFFTAHAENEEYRRRTREARIHVAEWLQKPLDTDHLLQVVERELQKRAQIKELLKLINEFGLNKNLIITFLEKFNEVMKTTNIDDLRDIMTHLLNPQGGKPPLAKDVNYQAFTNQKDELLEKFGEGFVGFLDGDFVGHNTEWSRLIKQVFEKHRTISIFTAELTKTPTVLNLISPRIVKR